MSAKETDFPTFQATDIDPRLTANEARRDVLYTMQHHPEVSLEEIEQLRRATVILERLSNV